MKHVIRFKWWIVAFILLLTIGLFFAAPNLTEQAEEAGTFQLKEGADSQRAAEILEEADASADTISIVFALDSALDDESEATIEDIITELESYGDPVVEVINPFANDELAAQFISEDQETVLLPITVEGELEEVNDFAAEITDSIVPSDLTAYVTGEMIINHEVNMSAQDGLNQTEVITVILVFALLLVVFRSIVTPFVPLVAVGLTYLLSQSIVAFLIEWVNFPVSNYTQIFLVAVLFGIGTDYCILLLSRYKEELAEGVDTENAIINTYKTAGKTLVASAVSGFLAFFVIIFADFPIYKSAAGVAIGVAVLLVMLLTIMPFFMAVLKDKLFWPSKKVANDTDSKLWKWMSKLAVGKPIMTIVIVLIITVPLLFSYSEEISFDMTDEIGSSYGSVKGLDRIEEAFGKGDALPIQMILKKNSEMTTQDGIASLEEIVTELESIDGVNSVRTITRPDGTLIEDLKVENQYEQIEEGFADIKSGMEEIENGLRSINENLTGITSQPVPGIDEQTEDAKSKLETAINIIEESRSELAEAQDVPALLEDLSEVSSLLTESSDSLNEVSEGYGAQGPQLAEVAGGLEQLATGVADTNDGVDELHAELEEAGDLVSSIEESDTASETGLFVPEEVLSSEDFEGVLDQYSFADGEGIFIEATLVEDPYSVEAIETLSEIKDVMADTELSDDLADAEIAYSGVTSVNFDLNEISSEDYTRTIMIMLGSLFVILLVLLRSVIMPIYMIGSLLITYYATSAVAELIFVNVLGYNGITWAVPFFGFVMLVALGVDYSIFLLERYKEEVAKGKGIKEAMQVSMAKMGSVIITASIILAGTFAAMMPSGVLSLMQIATIVITGLLLYGLIILPLLIPAVTVLLGKAAFFPWKRK
ncbi:MMPL family transporter [Saliterribacillus persicus]|uniref:RND superfamily putative drug exporter n=1 Tax=Saliterribacillus persicus TaxID=930114 RepID=A0A368XD10_9BACI|nr:MMPL family transporter [Saliterribacillus persicus]RCW65853.1 RND superfamily putative drug exporter [Saliterribacillus persicus]